jgi:Tfp pilus assembly PilM family ATPase
MANHIGLELLPDTCRVVEVHPSGGWFSRNRSGDGPTRVKAFHEIPYSPESPGACASELRRLLGSKGRDLRMAVWGLRSTHQVFALPQADVADLEMVARREARSKAAGAAASVGPTADGVTVGGHMDGGKVEVGYVSVPPSDVQARIQPFIQAGLGVASVVTPAVAHAALVRQRWGQFSDAGTAVLSVNARVTAMTVVRGGVVLFTRELPWGHQGDRGASFDAAAFASQLAAELRRSLVFLKQQSKVDVGHVLVCGDLPDLRALTGPLMHELNVEVETLDSLDGFDVGHLPEPADEFRSRIGALRTAWAMAVQATPAMSLVPRDPSASKLAASFDPDTRSRVFTAAVAGAIFAAALWGGATLLTRSSRARLDSLRAEVSRLGPEVARVESARQLTALVGARGRALEAFASQGPRLAAALQAIAHGAPGDIAIQTMTLTPGAGTWTIVVNGQAVAGTPAKAQSVFNAFLRSASASPLLGQPVRPPSLAVASDEPEAAQAETNAAMAGAGATGTVAGRDREDIEALARPRNVILDESWANLTDAERRTAEMLGRRPQRVQIEPHWHLHPGGVPKEVLKGVADYNAEQSNWERAVLASSGQAAELPVVERRPGSVLNFTVEFEVRK